MGKHVTQKAFDLSSPGAVTQYSLYHSGPLNSAAATRERAMQIVQPSAAAEKPVKRVIDVFGAITGIMLFGPLMLIIAALIKRQGANAVFSHERIGLNGKPFRCLKFRTMVPDAKEKLAALLASDSEARAEWERDHKLRDDPRITPLGAFLRKTSLDELPQFFNVLKGDMSLVGPRPITADECNKYGDSFILYVKHRPGITGIWQVSGRNDISYPARVELDSQYARNQSIAFDSVILLKTFGVVASRSGAR